MRATLIFLLLFPLLLPAYVDSDMDGVEDKNDLCPHTLMTDLVDIQGCKIKSLISPHHFSVMAGESYANDDNKSYRFSTLELDYYYKNFSLQLTSSYYNLKSDTTQREGLTDTNLNLFYRAKPLKNLSFTLGTGLSFPTYDSSNNGTDYTLSMSGRYHLKSWSLSTGMGYRFIGDSNASNSLSYYLSSGYNWSSKLYSSLGYYVSESIYEESDNYESLSLYNYYRIDEHWFGTLSLSKGLNLQSLDNKVGVKLGYYW